MKKVEKIGDKNETVVSVQAQKSTWRCAWCVCVCVCVMCVEWRVSEVNVRTCIVRRPGKKKKIKKRHKNTKNVFRERTLICERAEMSSSRLAIRSTMWMSRRTWLGRNQSDRKKREVGTHVADSTRGAGKGCRGRGSTCTIIIWYYLLCFCWRWW